MTKPVRRLITGNDPQGKSILISEANAHKVLSPLEAAPDLALTELWQTDSPPADAVLDADPTRKEMGLTPPKQGTLFRVVDFPPDATYLHIFQGEQYEKAWENMAASECADRVAQARHPMMHTTQTIDYGIVLEGEIYLILDETEHLMKAGDVVVQRSTNHAWSNRTDKICRMAFILVDAEKE